MLKYVHVFALEFYFPFKQIAQDVNEKQPKTTTGGGGLSYLALTAIPTMISPVLCREKN